MTNNLKLEDLRYANVQRNKEWDPEGKISTMFSALELGGEVGELLNIVKKLERQRMGLAGSTVSILDLAAEMADVLITLDLLAMRFSIDLSAATQYKFNSTSDKRGFKTKLGDGSYDVHFADRDGLVFGKVLPNPFVNN